MSKFSSQSAILGFAMQCNISLRPKCVSVTPTSLLGRITTAMIRKHRQMQNCSLKLQTCEKSFSTGYFSVPRNSMCSRKWATPGMSSGSCRCPAVCRIRFSKHCSTTVLVLTRKGSYFTAANASRSKLRVILKSRTYFIQADAKLRIKNDLVTSSVIHG